VSDYERRHLFQYVCLKKVIVTLQESFADVDFEVQKLNNFIAGEITRPRGQFIERELNI
jgi:hypothetical protein